MDQGMYGLLPGRSGCGLSSIRVRTCLLILNALLRKLRKGFFRCRANTSTIASCAQASRVGLDGLNKRLIKEMYDLADEPGPFCLDGLNNTHLDFAWNVGLEVGRGRN